jgi:DNA-binding transcriptional LysR family regulator
VPAAFRIASFSSSLRSVILPALGVLLRANPRVTCQAIKAEAHELHDMLIDGKVDFCVSLAECERMGVENTQIGVERNVLIESTRYHDRGDCYIDHEPRDNFTERFFLSQTGATVPTMQRAYFDDIYGLIDAVSAGIGRAVVPVHLVRPEHLVRAVPGYRPFEVPVILQYHGQPYYTRLHRALVETLTAECAPLLNANRQLQRRYEKELTALPGPPRYTVGRLATYTYIDMDQVIRQAMNTTRRILADLSGS